jgi:hypothetical protein
MVFFVAGAVKPPKSFRQFTEHLAGAPSMQAMRRFSQAASSASSEEKFILCEIVPLIPNVSVTEASREIAGREKASSNVERGSREGEDERICDNSVCILIIGN